MSIALSAIILLAAQASSTLPVKDNPKVVEDVTECRTIEDPMERLACFDSATKTLEEATENREVIVVETAEIEKEKERSFGLTPPDLRVFGGARPTENTLSEITSTITAFREFGYERWRFALADGSIWETSESESRLRIREGDSIRIKRAALGSFLAEIDDSPFIRVKRVE